MLPSGCEGPFRHIPRQPGFSSFFKKQNASLGTPVDSTLLNLTVLHPPPADPSVAFDPVVTPSPDSRSLGSEDTAPGFSSTSLRPLPGLLCCFPLASPGSKSLCLLRSVFGPLSRPVALSLTQIQRFPVLPNFCLLDLHSDPVGCPPSLLTSGMGHPWVPASAAPPLIRHIPSALPLKSIQSLWPFPFPSTHPLPSSCSRLPVCSQHSSQGASLRLRSAHTPHPEPALQKRCATLTFFPHPAVRKEGPGPRGLAAPRLSDALPIGPSDPPLWTH